MQGGKLLPQIFSRAVSHFLLLVARQKFPARGPF